LFRAGGVRDVVEIFANPPRPTYDKHGNNPAEQRAADRNETQVAARQRQDAGQKKRLVHLLKKYER